jgi:hypothetical protein
LKLKINEILIAKENFMGPKGFTIPSLSKPKTETGRKLIVGLTIPLSNFLLPNFI